MANTVFKLRRSTVSGKVPNTSTLSIGELAINLTDRKLYSSDGSAVFEPAANVSTLNVGNSYYVAISGGKPYIRFGSGQEAYINFNTGGNQTFTFSPNIFGTQGTHFPLGGSKLGVGNYQYTDFATNTMFQVGNNTSSTVNFRIDIDGTVNFFGAISANGSKGSNGQVLTSNGSGVYWKSDFDFATNTAAQYVWTNTHTFNSNVTTNTLILTGSVYSNGTLGVNGQVLTTNGSNTYWSSLADSSLPLRQQFTANGSITSFAIPGGYVANNISVFLNGVLLRNGTEVDVTSGVNVVISPAPANGALIDVIGSSSITTTGINTIVSQQFTANGTANTFTITGGYSANQVQVYLNGVKQIPGVDVDITSGNTVSFTATPSNGFVVDVFGYATGILASSNSFSVGSNVSITTNSILLGNSTVNTQIYAGNIALNGSLLTIGNSTVNTSLDGGTLTLGSNTATFGSAVYFVANGNVGIRTSSPTYALQVNGSFAATTKSFIIDHPTKEGMMLRYGSLEGPENGVYVRGKCEGSFVIDLPDYWIGLVDEDSITVSLTPKGRPQSLFIKNITNNKVHISSADDTLPYCHYHIFAERKDVEKLQVEIEV